MDNSLSNMINHSIILNQNFLDSNDESKCSPLYELPDEILLSIFNFLPMNDQLNLALVSKKWKKIAEDNTLWKERAALLGIVETEENPSIHYKKSLVSRCEIAIPLFQQANEIIKSPVLTGAEFDAQYSHFIITDSPEEEKISEYLEKLDDKLKKSSILKKGLDAGISLYKFKPSYTENLYRMAEVLNDKYECGRGWLCIAASQIKDNSVEALKIFEEHLMEDSKLKNEFSGLYIKVMSKHDIEKALQFFKDYPLPPMDWYTKEIISTLINHLFYKERFDLIEQGIDEKLWTDSIHILSLLRISQNETYQKRIVKKYQEAIENSEKINLKLFLPYLLKCNSSSYCFKLFEKHNMTRMDYYMIQDHFEGLNNNVEYNMIESLIESMKK